MKGFLKKISGDFFDALYPDKIKCIICDNELSESSEHNICEKCFAELPVIKHACSKCGQDISGEGNLCLDCKERKWSFKRAVAAFNFEGSISHLIYKLKYGNSQYLAPKLAIFMLNEYIKNDFKADIVLFVPQSIKRTAERGYNQAQLLAENLAASLNLNTDNKLLLRIKHTEKQTHLTHDERAKNLKGAFALTDKQKLKGKNILLIDDIFTTGATAEEISKTLIKAGSGDVLVLTLAHTYKRFNSSN